MRLVVAIGYWCRFVTDISIAKNNTTKNPYSTYRIWIFYYFCKAKPRNMRYKILDQNGLNYLTLTIVEWIDLFTRPVYHQIIIDSLKYCQMHKQLKVHAFVIMPSHLHLILSTPSETGLSSILRSFKSFTAKQISKYLKDKQQPESRREWLLNHFAFNARKSKTHSEYKIWQRDNHPIVLYSPKVIRQKLNYIHLNPP